MTKKTKLIIFMALFVALTLTPLVIMLVNANWALPIRDVSVALAFLGMSIAGMQFLPISRIPWLSDVVELDKMYKNHHLISAFAVLLVVLHPLVLLVTGSVYFTGFLITGGWIGLAGLVLIALTSIFRKQLKISYTTWLLIHDLLTLVILVFGLLHMFQRNYYMRDTAMTIAWIILMVIWGGLALYIRLIRPLILAKHPFAVEKVVEEGKDTYSVYLKADGFKRPAFKAGQVAWISKGPSPFVISRNPFSYSGSTEWDAVRFSIKKAGDFTNSIPDLKPGDRMFVDGPYGTFDLENPRMQKGLVVIGGGIGIAPVMSIINTLADTGDKRPVYVFYGDLCEDTVLFTNEFEALKSRMNLTVVQVLEKPIDVEKCEHKGYITKELLLSALPENYKELYYFMCGPMPMMNAMSKHLAAMEVDPAQIAIEKYEMA
ncbi:MAG: ferric reductase-like transmembrane domain-containing protein [Anaerolineaceae bacterium]